MIRTCAPPLSLPLPPRWRIRHARRPALALVVLVLSLSLPALAEDQPGPHAEGLDIGRTAAAIRDYIKPPSHGDKPWSDDLADLTAEDQRSQRRAIASLVHRGVVVLPDLEVLARDHDPLLRARVVEVAAGIGGVEPAPLVLRLSHDGDVRVRANATLGLGRCRGAGVLDRLLQLVVVPETEVRHSAAQALGGLGDVRALEALSRQDREEDDLVKRDMETSLLQIASQSEAVPEMVRLIGASSGKPRDVLVEASTTINDPRLCPALLTLLDPGTPPYTCWLALRSLGVNGDSRAWQALCSLAADAPQSDLQDAASAAMRRLTGKSTGSGQVWALWWRDHAAEAPHAIQRDILLAAWHDQSLPIDALQLKDFSVDELWPLVDGIMGAGPAWWPRRAYAIVRADDPDRWAPVLLEHFLHSADATLRLSLIVLLDDLGGPASLDALRRVQRELTARIAAENAAAAGHGLAADRGPEQVAVRIALERRGQKP